MKALIPLFLFLNFSATADVFTCLKVNQALADGPYEFFRDEEYPAFDPHLRDGAFVPRFVRKRTYWVRDQAMILEVINVETRPELSGNGEFQRHADRLGNAGREKHLADISGWVEFALRQYDRREWSEAFKEKLRQYAIDYAHRSTYIVAREASGGVAGKILGTMRLVSSSHYGEKLADGTVRPLDLGVPLAMERFLSLLLPRRWFSPVPESRLPPNVVLGEILEPGNYAILRGVDPKVGQQILAHFLNVLVRPSYGGLLLSGAKHLYTFGDETSVRKYGAQGFRVVEEYGTIDKDDTQWRVLEAHPIDLLEVLRKLEQENVTSGQYESLLRSFEYLLSPPLSLAI